MSVTIYHNPACGTSRNTLAMIRQSGEEPEVIEYLKTPPSRARLVELIAALGVSARELLREKGTPYAELGLADPKWSDDELIDFMLAHPILINRPIVVTPRGVRLCRPSELVLDLLDNPIESFVKEDGEVVEGRGGGDAEGELRGGEGFGGGLDGPAGDEDAEHGDRVSYEGRDSLDRVMEWNLFGMMRGRDGFFTADEYWSGRRGQHHTHGPRSICCRRYPYASFSQMRLDTH